ncbi:MAG: LEA type 2 family protein [Spirochaetia bacterium]|nr:LEA type 2 family protein [Spirochaetia bacterium]
MHRRIFPNGLIIMLLLLLASCATPPLPPVPAPEPPPPAQPAPPPKPEALPVLAIHTMKATALDQHRSRLTVTTTVQNPRSTTVTLLRPTLRLALPAGLQPGMASYELGTIQAEEDIEVAAFGESTFDLHFELDTRVLDLGIPGFRDLSTAGIKASLTATARVQPDEAGQPASGLVDLSAEAETQVPLIREPDLRILAINLVKHELINVILEVVLEVSNPNAFPLEFDQLAYDFFGEGKRWSRGQEKKALLIPARGSVDGTASTKIPVMLNFTEMDRRVFDLVEKLLVVHYRLAGTATVRTGLDFLPEFNMDFERPGAVKVERTLPRR